MSPRKGREKEQDVVRKEKINNIKFWPDWGAIGPLIHCW